MPVIDTTDYLFHYTSIEKLALILKNRTIRLNSLVQMDDIQEKKTADLKYMGRFIFVSCWTAQKKESIPMWNMYTDIKAGVRIGLPKHPFLWHNTSARDFENAIGSPVSWEGSGTMKTFLNLGNITNANAFSPNAIDGPILHKIKYTDDISVLEPKVKNIADKKIQISAEKLGKYKNTYWNFQEEWRYRMIFIPLLRKTVDMNIMTDAFNETINKMANDQLASPFDFYDLDIDPYYFEKMIITPSPQITEGNKIVLDALWEKYNPSATILDSELLGLY